MIGLRSTAPLARILAVRMTLTTFGVLLLLLGALLIYYCIHFPLLKQATLEREAAMIVRQLERGADPAHLDAYARYPANYGFRVFDRRLPELRRIIASANVDLLPKMEDQSGRAHPSMQDDGDLQTWFGRIPAPPGALGDRGWMRTLRVTAAGTHYWVQVIMFGDPAGQWVATIIANLLRDALLPALTLVPALTIAMFLTTRAALRPLSEVAREANGIGRNLAGSRAARSLPLDGLPSEIADVVAAINRMLLRLQNANDQQRQFTSDVAHELRTPLSVLLLEVGRLSPGPVRQHLSDEISQLGGLVNEMLRFAQAEDVLLHERLPVDVAAVTRYVCEELVPMALRHGQQIELFGAETACIVSGSSLLIEIAIRNVIENAIKYGTRASTVSVTVAAAPQVTVEDRGPGIPALQAERIFDRFWRSGTKKVAGSGVGLALAQRVAQLHDGEVEFSNRTGGGARFALTFAPTRAVAARPRQHRAQPVSVPSD